MTGPLIHDDTVSRFPRSPEMQARLQAWYEDAASRVGFDGFASLPGFGGVLRCTVCQREEPLGDPDVRVYGGGWPRCCGLTMRWWTQRLIAAGEDRAEQ